MGTYELVRRRATPVLRRRVAGYRGYRLTGSAPGIHRGLPSPYLTLIVTLDEPLHLAAVEGRRHTPDSFDALVGGLHTAPVLITDPGRQSGIQIAVHPLAARSLFGMPAGELARQELHLADVVGGPVVARLRGRLLAAPDWAGRFDAVDDVLAGLVAPDDARAGGGVLAHGEIAHAWRLLHGTRGRASVADVAREVGWSPRRLLSAFRRETGLTPKEAARVARFDQARRRLLAWACEATVCRARPAALAELAADSGYYDQAHLAREFRALAGVPPSRLVALEHRFVQAAPAGDDEQW
jgi:AraC-like DNA-binding protein